MNLSAPFLSANRLISAMQIPLRPDTSSRARVASVFAVSLLALVPAHAQVRLSGKVVSDTQSPVANATVFVRAETSGNNQIRTRTTASGSFGLDLDRSGDYLVDVECSGYYKLTEQKVSVAEGGAELNLVLTPLREYSESVEVTARPDPIDLDPAQTEETLNGSELIDIPYADNPGLKDSLPALPGVLEDGYGGLHLNGAPENHVLYKLDGFNVGDPLSGTFDPPVSVEAVRSMSTIIGAFPSEYGHGSAGVIDVTTNTGDDHFHYSATNFLPVIGDQKGWRILGWNPRFNLSGPLARGRAWFMDNFIPHYGQSVVPELPPGQDTSTDMRYSDYFHSQINLTQSNILYASALGSYSTADRSGLSALDPPSTTLNTRSTTWFGNVRDLEYLKSGVALEFGYASNHTLARDTPQGHQAYVSGPAGRSGNYYLDSTQHSSRDQVIANVYAPALHWLGAHQLKAGIDLDRVAYDQQVTRSSIEFQDAQENPIRTILYAGHGDLAETNFEDSSYVEDNWRIRNDLSVQIGVRSDWEQVLHDWSASPRLSAGWSPRALKNTKLSAGYSITRDEPDLRLFIRPEDQYPISTFFPPYGSGNQTVRSIFLLPNQHLSNPEYQTWSVVVDHRLPSNLYMRVEGLHRHTSNGLAYFGTPQTSSDSVYTLKNGRIESYDAATMNVRQSFGKEYGWLAGYTWSSAHSNAVFDASTDDYFQVASNAGPLDWDARNRVVSWAYLPTFRRKWSIPSFLEYRSGFPFSASNNAGIIAGPVNSYRFPDYINLNADLERRIRIARDQLAFRIGFDNITNHYNPTGVNNSIESNQFGQFDGSQGRSLVLRIRWLGNSN